MSREWLLRNLILPAGDALQGHPMMRRLKFLEQAQWWDRDRLIEEQNRLLREVVAIAYAETPFYRELWDNAGVKPSDIRTAADLPKLPIVTKDMLRSAYPNRVTRNTGQKTYEASTSGSTGKNFTVLEDNETAGWYRATFLLCLEWAGWRIGEPHLQTGMTSRSRVKQIKDGLLRCHYFPANDLRDESLDRALDLLDTKRIEHVWGYPGSLYYLARRARHKGWNRPLKSVVSWGDMLHSPYRTEINQAFRVNPLDTYGCGEGMQIAAQCEARQGYHLHMLDTVCELLQGNGCPVNTGDSGSVVLTRLHAGPMPLIRYQIGDSASLAVEGGCSCGRQQDRIATLQGREADCIVAPDGNRFIVHFFTGILEHFHQVESFQVVQDAKDHIVVRVVVSGSAGSHLHEEIKRKLFAGGARGLNIDVERVDEIPLTPGGKRRFVMNTCNVELEMLV